MSPAQPTSTAYTITGSRGDEHYATSRLQMQSAVVLATRLSDEGYTDVAIVDVDGAPLSLAAFQRRHRPELRPIRARRRA